MSKQKTDLQVFQEWVQELTGFVFGTEEKPKKRTSRKKATTKKAISNPIHPSIKIEVAIKQR